MLVKLNKKHFYALVRKSAFCTLWLESTGIHLVSSAHITMNIERAQNSQYITWHPVDTGLWKGHVNDLWVHSTNILDCGIADPYKWPPSAKVYCTHVSRD